MDDKKRTIEVSEEIYQKLEERLDTFIYFAYDVDIMKEKGVSEEEINELMEGARAVHTLNDAIDLLFEDISLSERYIEHLNSMCE